jgi:hypothetical protein
VYAPGCRSGVGAVSRLLHADHVRHRKQVCRCWRAVLEKEAGRRADSRLEVAVWGFSHNAGCGDILTSGDVGISSRKLGGGHGP